MNWETVYLKRGRRYVPYATNLVYPYGPGSYLVTVHDEGSQSIERMRQSCESVTPDRAATAAALAEMREDLAAVLRDCATGEHQPRESTERERQAWEAYCQVLGEEQAIIIRYPSMYEIAERFVARVKARMEETP